MFKTGTPKRSTSQIYLHFFVFVRGCQNSKKCKQICDVLIKGLIKPPIITSWDLFPFSLKNQTWSSASQNGWRRGATAAGNCFVVAWRQPWTRLACRTTRLTCSVCIRPGSHQGLPCDGELTTRSIAVDCIQTWFWSCLLRVQPCPRDSQVKTKLAQRQFVSGLPPGPSSFSKKTTRPGISSDPECQAKLAWDPRHWVEFPGLIV